ncbi:DUF3822 family protein [Hugenholtzia roseola]|uniref:DUF3822 family protein n=1 Tax=Hugenholtzia roseola TaxID=1002 RepID=UPI0013781AAB|nr:DUF3822 family protein [Hugenholtzia roseola]
MPTPSIFTNDLSLRDETIDLSQIGRYKMCLLITPEEFCVAAFDTRTDRCVAFERYEAQSRLYSLAEVVEPMSQILSQHAFWKVGYWQKITCMIHDSPFTFVPESYFEAEQAIAYLRLNGTPNLKTSYVQYTEHNNSQTTCLFTIPKEISDWIELAYPHTSISYVHGLSAFLEGIFLQDPTREQMHVLIYPKKMAIALMEEQELLFINEYSYNTPNELLYFILAVAQEYEIENPTLLLYGNKARMPEIADLLKMYISEVEWGKRPQGIFFGQNFNKIAQEEYFELFSCYYVS